MNSGNAPAAVAAYVKQVGLPWPVIVDTTRELETKAGVGQVSLNNVHQAAIITGSGQLQRASFQNIDGSVERALQGASWKVDPAGIPQELKAAWRFVEVGNYAAAAKDLAKHIRSKNAENKEAAQSLYGVVKADLQKEAKAAWDLGEEKQYYQAYVAMENLEKRFRGYPIPEKITKAVKWLGKKDEVLNEQRAQKLMDTGRPLLNSPKAGLRNRGLSTLKNVVKRFPDTLAAQEAQQLIDQAENATSGP